MREFNSPKNRELGAATVAYVNQTFSEDEIEFGTHFEVVDGRNGLTLYWRNDHPEPTDEQLEVALHRANWEEVRKQRNLLLVETDWHANTDVTMSDEVRTYRQALRDLPASADNSVDIVWPEKP